MEFDQPYNGANIDWNFPSPTATPTTATFGPHVFHTPKPTPPSHFQDAFTTPQMPVFNTPQPAQYPLMTPVPRPHTAVDGTAHGQYGYSNAQAWGQQNAFRTMAPPGQNQVAFAAAGSSPLVPMASMQMAYNAGFNGVQMQTPPPTRGTVAKRVQQQQHIVAAGGTPSTIASRRFLTPQQHTLPSNDHAQQPQQSTPLQFPQLQFSPDMYSFSNTGPISAPVMAGDRSFWGSSTSLSQPGMTGTLDDPFAPQESTWSNNMVPRPATSQNVSFETPAMSSFPVMEPYERPASAAALPSSTAPSQPVNIAVSVDPSLLYSSPAIARPKYRANKPKAQALAQEAKRKDSAVSPQNRPEAGAPASSAAVAGASTGLRRSNTIAGDAGPRGMLPSPDGVDVVSRSQSFVQQPPRTASPLKRSGRFDSTPDSKSRLKPSVILKVDENGRASTEKTRLEDTPTRSIRERYPGLFDSDSSDDESDSTEKTPSRAASFTFEKRDERKAKAAKIDPAIENLEGLNIPRSSSSASLNRRVVQPSKAVVAATNQLRRQSSARKLPASNRSLRRVPSSNHTATPAESSPGAETASSQQGAPSFALSMPGSSQQPQDHSPALWRPPVSFEEPDRATAPLQPAPAIHTVEAATELEEHNRRWSIMSFEQQQQQQQQPIPQHVSPQASFQHQSFQQSPQHAFGGPLLPPGQHFHPHQSSAGMPMPHHQPPMQPQQLFNPHHYHQQQLVIPSPHPPQPRQIRCACGDSTDRGGLPLLQCPSCTQWVHVSCVGLDGSGGEGAVPLLDPSTALAPPGFTCFLCTRPG